LQLFDKCFAKWLENYSLKIDFIPSCNNDFKWAEDDYRSADIEYIEW
jgi:hypothetical protein